MDPMVCPKCKSAVTDSLNFCPVCGFQLKNVPLTVSIGKQIGVYLLSFFLPPLGLFPAIKYIRKGDSSAKRAGVIAIILTVIAVAISIWLYIGFINRVNELINQQMSSPYLNY